MSIDRQSVHLATVVSQYIYDPLQFVLDFYPWGEPGELENETGPDENQAAFLRRPGTCGQSAGFRRLHSSDANSDGGKLGPWNRQVSYGRVDR